MLMLVLCGAALVGAGGRALSTRSFDYLVLGGGSGGLATARRAALRRPSARIGLVERAPVLGGTCVNAGCVPKKVMWHASNVAELLRVDATAYSFDVSAASGRVDWRTLREKRDRYVQRLNDVYARNVEAAGIVRLTGDASFAAAHRVLVDGVEYQAEHVCIAVGGRATTPSFPGAEHGITSDGFFALAEQPQRVTIVGGGYVGVELAGVLAGLGSAVRLVLRGDGVLGRFDALISDGVRQALERQGVEILARSRVERARRAADATLQLDVRGVDDQRLTVVDADCLLFATGRAPNTPSLNLAAAGIATDARGAVVVDAFENTTTPQHYAIGDVNGKLELTPVAIAAGRRLAERLFNGQPASKLDYQCVPSVVFSHPPAGSVGMTERDAVAEYGADAVRVYRTKFVNMYYALRAADDKPPTHMKIVTVGPSERVVGIHMVGLAVDEILQGFAVAVRMGATKKDLDATVAIHPTAAEELVTMT